MRITSFKALTFDCYGTLIDWEQGILSVLRPWADAHGVPADDDRLLAEFAKAESAGQRETPTAIYTDILKAVHHRIAEALNVPGDHNEANTLAASVGDWPPFADTVAALKELKKRHKLVIISNVDRQSFARTNRRLEAGFDAIITAEDVGAYKPDFRMFQRAFDVLAEMGIRRSEILHVAQSLYHDHVPAKALGLTTVWIDRRKGKPGGATATPSGAVTPDLVLTSLAELAAL